MKVARAFFRNVMGTVSRADWERVICGPGPVPETEDD